MNRCLILFAFMSITLLSASCVDHSAKVDKMAARVYNGRSLSGYLPPHAFKPDGCSCWPDGDWLECCVNHDLLYWIGGTREERKEADQELRKCVTEKGHPIVGQVMYLGVRIGGVWWLPTPFRWGFGWNYPDSGPQGKAY
jgi:hypothetical protein